MRFYLALLALVAATPSFAYTIDFEAASGFTLGQAPPSSYSTPWGDVLFGGDGVIIENPLEPGAQMLGPVPDSEFFHILLPPGIDYPRFLLVNPASEWMVVSYFKLRWDDCLGNPCRREVNDYGIYNPPESTGWLVLDENGAYGSGGADFYSGAHPDFDESRFCADTPEGCFYGWGVAQVSWVPEPGTAALLGLGLVALRLRHRPRGRNRA